MTAPNKPNRALLKDRVVAALQAKEEAAKALEAIDPSINGKQKAFAKAARELDDALEALADTYQGEAFENFDWGW